MTIQEVYDEFGKGLPIDAVRLRPQRLHDDRADIEGSGLFEVVDTSQFDWQTAHNADGYIDLLNTCFGQIAMEAWQRQRLYDEIRRRLAARPDGLLRRHWGAVLHVARPAV